MIRSLCAMKCGPEECEREWQSYLEWIRENTIGPPEATDKYTVKQLQDMGMVGIYAKEAKEEKEFQIKASASDDQGLEARLVTGPDFYCIHHKRNEA